MGYIKTPFAKDGTQVGVEVRGKVGQAEVVKMPFVPTRYFK
jgi:aminomethyltransferase